MKNSVHHLLKIVVNLLLLASASAQTIQIIPTSDANGLLGGDLVIVAQSSNASTSRIDFFAEDSTGATRSIGFITTSSSSENGTLINGRGTMNWTGYKAGLLAIKAVASIGGTTYLLQSCATNTPPATSPRQQSNELLRQKALPGSATADERYSVGGLKSSLAPF